MLFLLIVCILGSLFLLENFIEGRMNYLKEREKNQSEDKIIQKPSTEFEDLEVTYFGGDNKYQMNADFKNIIQEDGRDIDFKQLDGALINNGRLLRQFSALQGKMINNNGMLELKGSVMVEEGDYKLTMNQVNINLNKGEFESQGEVTVVGPDIKILADKMDSDFEMDRIHFTGRPRLIIGEGDTK